MFYVASKILIVLVQPSSLLWIMIALGFVLAWRGRQRIGVGFAVAGLAGMAVAGLTPVGNALVLPLEARFPACVEDGNTVDGIVMLGGAEDAWVSQGRGALELNESAERITETLRLALRHPRARIVLTGGSGALFEGGIEGMSAIARFLTDAGVSRDRIALETQARNTWQNAINSKSLMAQKPGERWLLVTSAYHMPRAVGVFRRVGLDIVACPVDYRLRGREDLGRWFGSIPAGLQRVDLGFKEWVGLVAYRLSGRSSALFPGPSP